MDWPAVLTHPRLKQSAFTGTTYLVSENEVKYVIRWKRTAVKDAGGRWTTTWDVSGEPASSLPSFVTGTVLQGYSDRAAMAKDEIRAVVPVPFRPKAK